MSRVGFSLDPDHIYQCVALNVLNSDTRRSIAAYADLQMPFASLFVVVSSKKR